MKQKIWLSATLPPYLETHFLEQLYLPPSTPIIRDLTNRNNLCYHVLNVESRVRNIKDVVLDLAAFLEDSLFGDSSCGIIFCTSRKQVDDIATSFNNTKSHSDMDAADRSAIQDKWFQSSKEHRWMVATTGFIHGIDQPNVDAVIFVELPYGMMNFIQGGGRAGRGNQPAHVFLVKCLETMASNPKTPDNDPLGVIPGLKYARNSSLCRREIISTVMDNHCIKCKDLHGAMECDLCNPNNPMVITSKALALAPYSREASEYHDSGMFLDSEIAMLDDAIFTQPLQGTSAASTFHPSMSLQLDHAIYEQLIKDKRAKATELTAMTKLLWGGFSSMQPTGYCVICWAWKNKFVTKTASHQYFISCKTREDHFVPHAVGWIDSLKRQLDFAKYRYCWSCGLPQGEYMPATHPPFKKGIKMECPFEDIIAVLIWHIIHDENAWRRACHAFGGLQQKMKMKEIVVWLNKEEQPHLFYNGLELVIWFWITIKNKE